jgi:hypothetical protein
MVQISGLLERQSGHNINQQISALQSLEQQGQMENATMREIAEKNSRDSSSMRVLTIITMIYLPCTIVSVSPDLHNRSTVTKFNYSEFLLDTIRQSERASVWWHQA